MKYQAIAKWLVALSTLSSVSAVDLSYADFSPIGCKQDTSSCVAWSSLFSTTNTAKVTIPCDKCVSMAEYKNGQNIVLDKGLDIQGTLYFPPGTKVTITTTFVTVQGKLSIRETEKINGVENVKFVMKGTDDYQFTPVAANAGACTDPDGSTTYCNLGKKTFAVPGGTLDVKAISDTCPTWVNLLDNVMSDIPVPVNYNKNPNPVAGCDRVAMSSDFNTNAGGWRSSSGATMTLTNANSHDGSKYLMTSDRRGSFQGPTIDLKKANLTPCITSGVDYLFSAKARLTNNGTPSKCSTAGTDCLSLKINTFGSDGVQDWKTLLDMSSSAAVADGEWFDFAGIINFGSVMKTTDIFDSFYIEGPEATIDISIDNVVIELPNLVWPAQNQQCVSLVTNGDAEASAVHPYPMELFANPEAALSVATESNGNKFFKVKGRSKTWASLSVPLNPECAIEYTEYRGTAKIWLQSDTPQMVTMAIRRNDPNDPTKTIVRPMGECKESSKSSGWVECSQPFMLTAEYANATELGFFFRSEDQKSDLWLDDISIELVKTPVKSIVVPASVAECWDVGAEIFTTSHTIQLEDTVASTITSITANATAAIIGLNNTMEWHTTYAQDPMTSVEVALLSRKVVITHAYDDVANPNHGGNFMILQTPNVVQLLQGVEMRGQGQQGVMGKYPIHFHLSTYNPNSLISKNTVRDSNQRCIVIHNTHNTTVSWNIAYRSFGHCFMTEDGIEANNTFSHNLGVHTKKMPKEKVLSIAESDFFAATFWISSPSNYFTTNVAAGSEDNGFWYEMLEMVRGASLNWDENYTINPSIAEYGHNIETIIHSNIGDGFKLYPNGYFPEDEASFKNMRSYRNKGDGVLLHNSRNLAVEGGYFADNRQGVEVDKQADAVRVSNNHFVGFSQLFMDVTTASVKKSHCPAFRPLVGVQLHSYLRYRDSRGYLIENNTFEMYGETLTGCEGSSAMNIDPQVRDSPPHYDAYATFANNKYEDGIPIREKFDACKIFAAGVRDMAIDDQTGDLNPVNPGTPGFIVSNSSLMTAFVEGGCHEMEGACTLYCENVCYRTVNFAVPVDEPFMEAVLRATNDKGVSQDFGHYFEYVLNAAGTANSTLDNFIYVRRRYFSAILPYGTYELQFYKNNTPFHPRFFEVSYDDEPMCTPFIDNTTVTVITSEPDESECMQLIKNGGGEDGTFDYWQHAGGDIQNANPGYLSSRALATVKRTGAWHGLGQYIDTRCLVEGQQYEVTARFRLQGASGAWLACDPLVTGYSSTNVCPRVSMRMRHMMSDEKDGAVNTTYVYPIAETLAPVDANSWNFIYGVLTVTADMANATSVFLWIERYGSNFNMVLDEFSIVPVVRDCKDANFNRDLEAGDLRWWNSYGQSGVTVVSPGYNNSTYAIGTSYRKQFWASMVNVIKPECLVNGTAYQISAKIKLERNGAPYDCNPAKYWGPIAFREIVCPTLAMRVDKGNETLIVEAGKVNGQWKSGEWNDIFGLFLATDMMATADSMFAWFTKFSENTNIIVDNLSVQPEEGYGCDLNIIHNGDAEYGDVRSWVPYYAGHVEVWNGGANSSNYAIAYVGSLYWHEGLGQNFDRSCAELGITYEASAEVKLFEADMVTPYACNATTAKTFKDPWRCPAISIAHQNPGSFPNFTEVAGPTTWSTTDWNKLTGTFSFTDAQLNASKLWIDVHNTKPGLVIVVDNFVLKKV